MVDPEDRGAVDTVVKLELDGSAMEIPPIATAQERNRKRNESERSKGRAMTQPMTSRERLLTALEHQEPDRVPIDLGGFQTGIHKDAYLDLLKYLGIQDQLVILDPVQQLAKPCEAVLERLRVDVRYLVAHGPDSFKGGIERNARGGRVWLDLKDEFGVVWSMPEDQQLYMDISHHPLATASLAEINDYPFPNGGDPTRFSGLREQAPPDAARNPLRPFHRHRRRGL